MAATSASLAVDILPALATPEDRLDASLHALVAAADAVAGAVCLFDDGESLLRLAAETGLSDDGCRLLRTMRDGGGVWDMPLRSVREGRAYVDAGRVAPRLVEAGVTIGSVASLPVYAGAKRLGSVVLVTRAPRALDAGDLEALAVPLADVRAAIESLRERPMDAASVESLRAALATLDGEREELYAAPGPVERADDETPPARVAEQEALVERLLVTLREAEASATAAQTRARALEEACARSTALATRERTLHAALEAALERRATDASEAAERTRGELTESCATVDRLLDEAARAQAEIERLAVAADAAAAETAGARAAREAAEAREREAHERLERALAALREPVTENEAVAEARAPAEPVAMPEPEATPPAEPAPRARASSIDPALPWIAVLDTAAAWERATVTGHQVAVLHPGADLAGQLAAAPPARIVANLAAPGVFAALAALRAAGCAARVWACLATPATDRAVLLGTVETVAGAPDCDAVRVAIERHATRGMHVLTAGGDVDAFMRVRQAMARQHVAMSMAWDAKQAAELVELVRPRVAVVDLGLPARDGYAIVASLAATRPPPALVLIGPAGDPAADLAAALASRVPVERITSLESALVALLGREEPGRPAAATARAAG